MLNKRKGFTLVELLVVIAIIGVLATIIVASLSSARSRARDSRRQSDIRQIQGALELYYGDHASYPSTGGGNSARMDPGCGSGQVDWIPGLVAGGYIPELPSDPNPINQARSGNNENSSCYIYQSRDGQHYILSAWSTVENGPLKENDGLYTRAGFREAGYTAGLQTYLCDHPNIGNPGPGDYYRYSYTVTNHDCNW